MPLKWLFKAGHPAAILLPLWIGDTKAETEVEAETEVTAEAEALEAVVF
jgi:hypothetical protein